VAGPSVAWARGGKTIASKDAVGTQMALAPRFMTGPVQQLHNLVLPYVGIARFGNRQ
jgi:hypothetical protein